GSEAGGAPIPASGREILSLTGEVAPGDRQLGDLLQSLELVEADTLTALLVDARRQRRTLRQVLLVSGYLTAYPLALIRGGHLDALVLGPVRVVDRLRATAHEAAYRVFDPRSGREAVLRHLSESEARDAVHPDEFRQRFAAAAVVRHPHLAATLEVLEIAGRPAALQELLTGLPSTDWPQLVAVPGVCYRLLCQAALGLATAPQAGLVHGHLDAGSLLLTADGTLKLCGFGEPPWLAAPSCSPNRATDSAEEDILALGQLAGSWLATAPKRKNGKSKAADPLQAILKRLPPGAPEPYPSAAALLDDLDRAGADVTPNAEAWHP